MDVTDGTLLGGRVVFRQPRVGYRTGIEPVLLAASVAARPGERVLEGGTGAGAAMLCLLARVPGVSAVGVERDAALAALARDNIAANGAGLAAIMEADILDLPAQLPFDHAMANPPWHGEQSTASPDGMRDGAKRAGGGRLGGWAAALGRLVRPRGSVTVIVPASSADDAVAALADAACGDLTLLPLWPRAGREARLLLIRGIKASRGPCRILPGLVLHEGDRYADLTHRILWDGEALAWE